MAPNPIDFDKVFTEFDRLPETGNVDVIIAVSCVFGFYLLLLVWARKADKKDALKVGTVSYTGMNVFFSFTVMNASFLSSKFTIYIHLSLLTMTSIVLILAVCRTPVFYELS